MRANVSLVASRSCCVVSSVSWVRANVSLVASRSFWVALSSANSAPIPLASKRISWKKGSANSSCLLLSRAGFSFNKVAAWVFSIAIDWYTMRCSFCDNWVIFLVSAV